MGPRMARIGPRRGALGQASLLLLGVVVVLLAGLAVLLGFGQALGAKSRHQRAADLGFPSPRVLALPAI